MKKFKAGTFVQHYEYKSFRPTLLNKQFSIDDSEVLILLDEANRQIGELNAYSKLIPDVDFFIHMHVRKEANQSSRIEGTKTNFDELFLDQEEIKPERRDDWIEVQNYTRALNYAIEKLESLPLSMRLLKETHEILLSGVRGEKKLPGEVRNSQNWIGGSSLKDAYFIPPHKDYLQELLSDFEYFLHNEKLKIPELIKVALAHYQFETIHPFLDGNGRIGRLLITLYLIEGKILSKPTLYLSDFFMRNRGSYYDSLMMVRQSNNIKGWIKFFLNGIIETSNNAIETFEKIIQIKESCALKILGFGKRSHNAGELIRHMYSKPILTINEMAARLGMSHQATSALAKMLEDVGILEETTGFKRNKHYKFKDYISLFSSG